VSDVLHKRARGARMVTWPAKGAILLASTRGAASIVKFPRADPFDASSPKGCFCQVYVDGIRLYPPNGNSAAPDLSHYDAGPLEAVESIPDRPPRRWSMVATARHAGRSCCGPARADSGIATAAGRPRRAL
jgi:hypothetical protein